MRIKNKLTLGICILFAMILMLGTLAISSVYELDRNSRNIYDANNNSLNYARSMLVALEKIDSDPAALDVFIENFSTAFFEKKNDLQYLILIINSIIITPIVSPIASGDIYNIGLSISKFIFIK